MARDDVLRARCGCAGKVSWEIRVWGIALYPDKSEHVPPNRHTYFHVNPILRRQFHACLYGWKLQSRNWHTLKGEWFAQYFNKKNSVATETRCLFFLCHYRICENVTRTHTFAKFQRSAHDNSTCAIIVVWELVRVVFLIEVDLRMATPVWYGGVSLNRL